MAPTPKGTLLPNRIKVAVALLGLDAGGYRRTQTEVSDLLGIPKSTVNECVGDLVKRGCIRCTDKTGRERIYSKGTRFALLESQLTAEILGNVADLNSVRANGRAVTYPDPTMVPEPPSEGLTPVEAPRTPRHGDGPVPLAYGIHLNSESPRFSVDRQGILFDVPITVTDPVTGVEREVNQTLFHRDSYYELRGGQRWTGTFVMPVSDGSGRFGIEYHRTNGGADGRATMHFYVKPEFDVLMSASDVNDMDKVRVALIAACAPMLIWLEKHAGWVFAKDGCGRYELLTGLRSDKIHRVLRGPVNDLITELTDGTFGVSNEGLWADRSPGYVELETNSSDYIESITALPDTTRKANIAYETGIRLEKEITQLRWEMSELVDISKQVVVIGRNIMEAQTHSFRILSNQTALDLYTNPVAGKSEGTAPGPSTAPTEGYH